MLPILLTSLLLAASLTTGCDLIFDTHHASDEALEETFRLHEEDFVKLLGMVGEDRKVVRIAHDFTWLDDNVGWPRPESELGFSKQRWDEYRRLFDKLGLDSGIKRLKNADGAILFMASTTGNVGGGAEKGFAYLTKEPSLVVQSLDPIPKVAEYTPVYKKLKGNWYLYYMWAG